MTLETRKTLTRPRRILSIDGGGIRGVVAAEILLEIEKILCHNNTPWSCLADYFDLIGGTSTGSILASAIAMGMKVQDILDLYINHGREIFTPNVFWKRWLFSRYKSQPLEKKLKELFGYKTLESKDLKTFLAIVSKNATTARNYFFINHPDNRYYEDNQSLQLWQLIRASTAAPTFFPPERMTVKTRGKKHNYEFIDGGMSMFNNPSFQLFVESTQPKYRIGWKTGADNLLLVSIGTGFSSNLIPFERAKRHTLLNWAPYAIGTLMEDANVQQNFIMGLIGQTPPDLQRLMDNELENLSIPSCSGLQDTSAGTFPSLLTYHRYTTVFSEARFRQLQLDTITPAQVATMDAVDQIQTLRDIGQAIAREQVRAEYFDNFRHEDTD
ncbi:patatin-like phospholipase family protein [Phormidium yuhuli AB48]|uniref:Patatin-like phospholipase family protein n=1 Tax=Phormidium yuhuli AB48 TaxID=2940671 RepID=A0ABY5APF4_9CYAN|nr:patatin-like phospholipase family protein [Phormidium yuhuli]USR90890.1 patatin-like phospholipase family protein [Phormidium yuhuli AB48]